MSGKTTGAVYIIVTLLAFDLFLPGGMDAAAQLGLPSVPGGLRDLPTDTVIDRRIRSRAERAAERAREDAGDDAADAVGESANDTAEATSSPAGKVGHETAALVAATVDDAVGTVETLARSFVPATDPNGALVESDIIVALVEPDERERLLQAGYRVVAERELKSLGLAMLTVRRPAGLAMSAAVEHFRKTSPGAAVDYNHIYSYDEATDSEAVPGGPDSEPEAQRDNQMRIGIIDSAVLPGHRGLNGSRIFARDFVNNDGERPLTHGTAVASLVVRSAGNRADIYSASVFFQLPGHAPGASSESLVAALDWLAAEQVDAINMSLSGPGNLLLQTAVAALHDKGQVVVAAVGNNGPGGEPLYPAAYDNVIGVTAVDRDRRIFRNANRGKQVDYAALGVNVKVADSETGGWRLASGTSMASPHVAVVVATTLRESGVESAALMSWLMASAEDLGRKGFDPVYGHGLITQPPIVVSDN